MPKDFREKIRQARTSRTGGKTPIRGEIRQAAGRQGRNVPPYSEPTRKAAFASDFEEQKEVYTQGGQII